MSTFYYPITLFSPDKTREIQIKSLVDTGSTYTRLPGNQLRAMGYKPSFQEVFELGDGRTVQADVGEAIVSLDGKSGNTRVIFGKIGEEPLLGAVTLEEFLFAPDPIHRRLLPVRGLLV